MSYSKPLKGFGALLLKGHEYTQPYKKSGASLFYGIIVHNLVQRQGPFVYKAFTVPCTFITGRLWRTFLEYKGISNALQKISRKMVLYMCAGLMPMFTRTHTVINEYLAVDGHANIEIEHLHHTLGAARNRRICQPDQFEHGEDRGGGSAPGRVPALGYWPSIRWHGIGSAGGQLQLQYQGMTCLYREC